uniref:Uncharacterized protein n=1 Tax=Eptatretus burgeri TaxID=7764 RepID=A0A8C4NMU8_EPTBU
MQDGISMGRKEDATNGVHSHKYIYLQHVHIYSHAINGGRGQDTSKVKALQPTISNLCTELTQFLLTGNGATNIHSKAKPKENKRLPPQTGESDRVGRPLWRGTWQTERIPRDRCRLPAPSWCDGGQLGQPRLCSAFHRAGELSPALSTWMRRLGDRAGKAAPPVRVPGAPPGLPTDCELRQLDPNHRTQDSSKTKMTKKKKPQAPTKTTTHPHPGVLRALISPRSNASPLPFYRSAHLPAPAGSFQKRGVPSRPLPCTPRGGQENHSWHRSREIHSPKIRPPPFSPLTSGWNRTSPTPKRGKSRRENPRTIGTPLVSFAS